MKACRKLPCVHAVCIPSYGAVPVFAVREAGNADALWSPREIRQISQRISLEINLRQKSANQRKWEGALEAADVVAEPAKVVRREPPQFMIIVDRGVTQTGLLANSQGFDLLARWIELKCLAGNIGA